MSTAVDHCEPEAVSEYQSEAIFSRAIHSLPLIAAVIALWLSVEFLLLGRLSWIPYYGAGADTIPTYLGLTTSQSGYSRWAPFIAGGLDRLSFWGSGDPLSLELLLFGLFPVWLANGLYMLLQRYCAIYFTALICRDHFGLDTHISLLAGVLHAIFGYYCVGHLLTAAAVPMFIWIMWQLAMRRQGYIWSAVFGLAFSSVTSVAQGLPYLIFFFGLYSLTFLRRQLPQLVINSALFAAAVMLVKYPMLLALVRNAPFSQRALWPHMSEEVRSIFLGSFILWPETNFHYADAFSHLSSRLIQGFALVIGPICAVTSLCISRCPRIRALDARYLKLVLLYGLVGSSVWIYIRDRVSSVVPWIIGIHISRIVIVPAPFLNAMIVALTIVVVTQLHRERSVARLPVIGVNVRGFIVVMILASGVASAVMARYQGFAFVWMNRMTDAHWPSAFVVLFGASLMLIWLCSWDSVWSRRAIRWGGAGTVAVLLISPKVTVLYQHMIEDFNAGHYGVASEAELKQSDRGLFRVASVLPLQPSYAYAQGLETVDGWALLYPRVYRELWIRIVAPLVKRNPRARHVFDPTWKYPEDHYVFLGIGDLLEGESLERGGMQVDARFNMTLLSMLNAKYLLSEWPLMGEYLRPRVIPSTAEAVLVGKERDYSVGRYIEFWPERRNWSLRRWAAHFYPDLKRGVRRSLHGKSIFIYENRCVVPRFRFVREVRLGGAEVLEEIAMASPATVNDVAWAEAGLVSTKSGLSSGSVTVAAYSADEIVLNLVSSGEGFLVVGNTWNPFWVAIVDGKRRDLVRTNYAQLGLWTRGSDRQVRLVYRPPYSHWASAVMSHMSRAAAAFVPDQQPFSGEPICRRNTVK